MNKRPLKYTDFFQKDLDSGFTLGIDGTLTGKIDLD